MTGFWKTEDRPAELMGLFWNQYLQNPKSVTERFEQDCDLKDRGTTLLQILSWKN